MTTPDAQLPPDTLYHLQRCDGFLDLNMPDAARREWDQVMTIPPGNSTAEALLLRLLLAECRWADACTLARSRCDRAPTEPGAWIQWAYAARRAHSVRSAETILQQARDRFPKEPVIVYNLACYSCLEGRIEQARELLAEATSADEQLLAHAGLDEDLRALWPELPEQ